MSDLIYRQAVTEDGEPVAVTEWAGGVGDTAYSCSWAVILPGDTVRHRHGWRAKVTGFVDDGEDELLWLADEPRTYKVRVWWDIHSVNEYVDPADLTLVCGSPKDNPHRFGANTNPAWRWD